MKKDILVVDDDANQRHLLSVLLESEGFDVATAPDGEKALELLGKTRFRMIITDFNMPGMTGIELAARARKQNSDTHIVLVTADTVLERFNEAVGAGITRIFNKPIDLKRLVTSVRSSLSKTGLQKPVNTHLRPGL